jgi:hypothetical protein
MTCAIERAELVAQGKAKESAKNTQRYRLILMATPYQKKLMKDRNLSLEECEALQKGTHLIEPIPVAKLSPLVPPVPGAPLPIDRVYPLVVEKISEDEFLILDGNQWYHRKLKGEKDTAQCIIYPSGSIPVFQHYRLNRHPLSLYVTWLLLQTKMTIGEISFSLNMSYARIAEAFQAIKALPEKELQEALASKKHVTISQLEKVTDPLAKSRGRPKSVPPVVPMDLLEELMNEPEMPDTSGLLSMLVRVNQMHRGKALAMATLLCAYGKIPAIQPNNKLVRTWLLHLPRFVQDKLSQTELENKPSLETH